MKLTRRIISLLLVIVMMISVFPSALAAENTPAKSTAALDSSNTCVGDMCLVDPFANVSMLLEVTKDNAPIRSGPGKTYSVLVECAEGAVLKSTGSTRNKYNNRWYKVEYDGQTGYLYEGNVTTHFHDYYSFTYDDVTYNVCDCGKVTATVTTTKVTTQQSNAMSAASSAAVCTTMALADGPAPVGDAVCVGMLAVLGVMSLTAVKPTTEVITTIIEDIDFSSYSGDELKCYRKIQRINGKLYYQDDEALGIFEAYEYVMTKQESKDGKRAYGDVWCETPELALALASLHGEYYSERDKDMPSYFYHYHLGPDKKHKVGGHIFYGTNDYGETPIG